MEEGGEKSSGFFGSPALADLDQDGDWEILVPRGARSWHSTIPPLARDLLLEPAADGFRWSVLDEGHAGARKLPAPWSG